MELIKVLHYLVYLIPMLYVLLSKSTSYYDLILAGYIFITIHWAVLKGECILNYLEKKANDCNYKLGDRPDENSLNPIMLFIGTLSIITILFITMKLKLNVPIVAFITIVPRIIILLKRGDPLRIRRLVAPLLGMYILKDNQYFIPGLLGILIGSCIVTYKDKNSCIRGSQVSHDKDDVDTFEILNGNGRL
jgi:hypothetical protein